MQTFCGWRKRTWRRDELYRRSLQYYFDQLKRNEHESCDLSLVVDYPLENKSGGRGIRVVNTMRKWCCRFKKRWQVRHGQMMEREFMPPSELKEKARLHELMHFYMYKNNIEIIYLLTWQRNLSHQHIYIVLLPCRKLALSIAFDIWRRSSTTCDKGFTELQKDKNAHGIRRRDLALLLCANQRMV